MSCVARAAIVSTAAVIVQTQFRIAGRIGDGKDRVPASASVALLSPLSGARRSGLGDGRRLADAGKVLAQRDF